MPSLIKSLEFRIQIEQKELDHCVELKFWTMVSHHNSVIIGLMIALKIVKDSE